MSYKYEMKINGKWTSNKIRFATKDEAHFAGQKLYQDWLAVEDIRTTTSEDEVTHAFINECNEVKRIANFV